MSLAQKQRPADPTRDLNAVADTSPVGEPENSSRHDTGTMVMSEHGTSYIDSANWRAILEEVGSTGTDVSFQTG